MFNLTHLFSSDVVVGPELSSLKGVASPPSCSISKFNSSQFSKYLNFSSFDIVRFNFFNDLNSSPVTPPPTDVSLPDQKFLYRFRSHGQRRKVPPQVLVGKSNFGRDHQIFFSLLWFEHSVSRHW